VYASTPPHFHHNSSTSSRPASQQRLTFHDHVCLAQQPTQEAAGCVTHNRYSRWPQHPAHALLRAWANCPHAGPSATTNYDHHALMYTQQACGPTLRQTQKHSRHGYMSTSLQCCLCAGSHACFSGVVELGHACSEDRQLQQTGNASKPASKLVIAAGTTQH
jgi:hypothetical protein